jgi:hypothetical protein
VGMLLSVFHTLAGSGSPVAWFNVGNWVRILPSQVVGGCNPGSCLAVWYSVHTSQYRMQGSRVVNGVQLCDMV